MQNKKVLGIILIFVSIVACSVRPDEAEVQRMFTERNPGTDEVQVQIDKDEGTARAFVITYKVLRTEKKFKQTWVFVNQDKDHWTQYPAQEM